MDARLSQAYRKVHARPAEAETVSGTVKTQLTPQKRLTDLAFKSVLRESRTEEVEVSDGSVPGLSVRLRAAARAGQ